MEFNSIYSHQDETPRMHYTHGTESEGKMKREGKKLKKKLKKKKSKKKFKKKTSSEWITEVMSQAAKEPQQDGTSQHLLS